MTSRYQMMVEEFVNNHAPTGSDVMTLAGVPRLVIHLGKRLPGCDCKVYVDMEERKTEITWASTSRTVAEATAAVAIYERMVQFAAILEVWLGSLPPMKD
jgi:hypothetical protein